MNASRYAPALALLAASLLTAPRALAQAGTLDPSFGTDGVITFSATDLAGEVAVQPDGKIVVAGNRFGDGAVWRFHPDGTPDLSFSGDGVATVNLGGPNDLLLDVAVLPDGAILAAGSNLLTTAGDGDGAVLARFHPDGTLDASFGTGGLVREPDTPGTPDAFWALDVRPDGRILTSGPRGNLGFAPAEADTCYAVQYLADGTRDPAFGSGGVVAVAPGGDAYCVDGALMPDGRYVLGLNVGSSFATRWGAARLLEDGTLDASFAGDGIALTDGVIGFQIPVVVESEGAVTLGGASPAPVATLLRFTANGDLDASFGAGGMATLVTIGPSQMYALARQSDGKLLPAGNTDLQSGPVVAFLARTHPDGTLDASFGTGGVTHLDLTQSPSGFGTAWAVGLDGAGRILMAGPTDYNATPRRGFVARFLNDKAVANEPPAGTYRLALDGPVPNPVRARATLAFTLAEPSEVRLALYDPLGREAVVLLRGIRSAGTHEVTLDASRLAPGLYVLRLEAGGASVTRRLTVVR